MSDWNGKRLTSWSKKDNFRRVKVYNIMSSNEVKLILLDLSLKRDRFDQIILVEKITSDKLKF